MANDYKDLSERDKQVSNLQHLDTLNANTDQVEAKLDILAARIDTLTTVVEATNSRLTTANGLLQDIKNNTAKA